MAPRSFVMNDDDSTSSASTFAYYSVYSSKAKVAGRPVPHHHQRPRAVALLLSMAFSILYSSLSTRDARANTQPIPDRPMVPSAIIHLADPDDGNHLHYRQQPARRLLAKPGAPIEMQPAYCVAFRATRNCTANGGRAPWLDLSCEKMIPAWHAGYCEFMTQDGETFRVMHKRCFRWEPNSLFSCNMAADFLSYQYEARLYQPNPPMVLSEAGRARQQDLLEQQQQQQQQLAVTKNKKKSSISTLQQPSRGIVMAVYDSILVGAYAMVRLLREHHNCALPVELWSSPDEVDPNNPFLQKILSFPNVTRKYIRDETVRGFMTKPFSIFYSSFDQVMLLDADSFPVQNPSILFDHPEFERTGAIFFKDYWQPENALAVSQVNEQSMIWELLGIPYQNEFEMESGQMVIDKAKSERALNTLMYLSSTFASRWLGPLYMVWGDKDLFRFSWRMTDTEYFLVPTPPAPVGYRDGNLLCGVSMVQFHPTTEEPLFVHRNQLKFKTGASISLQRVWHGYYRFIGTDATWQYRIGDTKSWVEDATCYHPVYENAVWFEEVDTRGTPVEAIEAKLVQYASE